MAAFLLPGGWEWILIVGVVLLLFGPTQLPKLAKMFGKSAKALKEGMEGTLEDDDDDAEAPAKAKATKSETDQSDE